MTTESRGASNAKAKRDLGWRPSYPSWRTGFRVPGEFRGHQGGLRTNGPVA
jgi:hypothetical protein